MQIKETIFEVRQLKAEARQCILEMLLMQDVRMKTFVFKNAVTNPNKLKTRQKTVPVKKSQVIWEAFNNDQDVITSLKLAEQDWILWSSDINSGWHQRESAVE